MRLACGNSVSRRTSIWGKECGACNPSHGPSSNCDFFKAKTLIGEAAVPEPGTLALLCVALTGLVGWRGRRGRLRKGVALQPRSSPRDGGLFGNRRVVLGVVHPALTDRALRSCRLRTPLRRCRGGAGIQTRPPASSLASYGASRSPKPSVASRS